MHTEDQAAKKICPHTRTMPADAGWEARHCIGSRCMAWHWNGYFDEGGFWERTSRTTHRRSKIPVGYCGLAGKPE